MRNMLKATTFVAMLAIPTLTFAQATTAAAPKAPKAPATQTAAPAAPAKAAKKTAVAKHTTSGTVKTSSDSSLVITKGGKDQTFVVNSSTEKKGTIEAGAKVSVHYTMDGSNMVATAVTASPVKAAKAAKAPKKADKK